MATTLLERFLEQYDTVHHGMTPEGIANGLTLTVGRSWCRRAGGYTLQRIADEPVDTDNAIAVGAASPASTSSTFIAPFATYPLAASTVYHFGISVVSPGGAQRDDFLSLQRIETDGDGVPIDPVPNPPVRLRGEPYSGGRIKLNWDLATAGEQVQAKQWNVYHNNGSGSVDYDTAIASVNRGVYVTEAYAGGTEVTFGVRAESADGDEEKNTNTVAVTADDTGPQDIDAPDVDYGEES